MFCVLLASYNKKVQSKKVKTTAKILQHLNIKHMIKSYNKNDIC